MHSLISQLLIEAGLDDAFLQQTEMQNGVSCEFAAFFIASKCADMDENGCSTSRWVDASTDCVAGSSKFDSMQPDDETVYKTALKPMQFRIGVDTMDCKR